MGEAAAIGALVRDAIYRVDSLPGPEGLGEILWAARRGGGVAANFAVAYTRAGGRAVLVSSTGSDGDSEELLRQLEALGVSTRGVKRRSGGPVRLHIYEDEETRIFFLENRRTLRLEPAEVDPYLGAELVFTDLFTPEAALHALQEASAAGTPTAAILAHGLDAMEGWGLTWPMLLRAADMLDLLTTSLAVLRSLPQPRLLLERLTGRGEAVVTMGAEGSIVIGPWGALHVPALPVQPVDTTGAGDAYTGFYARLRLVEGLPPRQAATIASAAASLKCTRVGAWSSPGRAEAEEAAKTLKDRAVPLGRGDAVAYLLGRPGRRGAVQ